MCLNTAEWLVFSLVLNTPLATRPLRFPVAECSMSREWVPLCFGTSRVTSELWLLGTLFGFMGHIQQPLTLKNGKSAYKWMHYCGRKKKNKEKSIGPQVHYINWNHLTAAGGGSSRPEVEQWLMKGCSMNSASAGDLTEHKNNHSLLYIPTF